jgi:hypothetical protein
LFAGNKRQCRAAVDALIGIKPRDELEGTLPRLSGK